MSDAKARFDQFISRVRDIWAEEADMARRMDKVKPELEALISTPSVIAATKEWPSTEGRGNLLLYSDPDADFVVNAVVREPGRKGNVHDHADAWVLYGLVDGQEHLERYDRVDDGQTPGHAVVRLASVTEGRPGHVDVVAPNAIHAERGGADRSVAMIFRSVRLVGRVLQKGYDPIRNTVTERSGPNQIPFSL
jgi:predicted metal-dependent enzyme (double-stranded beta helix superfamily)